MNKKSILYLILSSAVILSIWAFFLSRETKKEIPDVSDKYEIWETTGFTESSKEKSTKLSTTSIKSKASDKVTKTKVKVTTVQTSTEFLYLDLNVADAEDFMKLKGIGEVTAARIIEYRNTYGPFYSTEDIMNVAGIGEGTYINIREHIYVTYIESEVPSEPSDYTSNENNSCTNENPTTENVQTTEAVLETIAPEIPILNINTASAEDFMKLPGIDKETAESIVSLRTSIQYFSNILELLYADKMTREKFIEIKDYIYVS